MHCYVNLSSETWLNEQRGHWTWTDCNAATRTMATAEVGSQKRTMAHDGRSWSVRADADRVHGSKLDST